MPIRMTGLTSGLDTESIVNQLMSAQRTKQTKVENKKQKLEWKQEIWKGLNTKIYGFYKDSLSKMKYSSNYSTKKASVEKKIHFHYRLIHILQKETQQLLS